MASKYMMSIDDGDEFTSVVDAINLDSEYHDTVEEDEDYGILTEKEIWEISTQIGLDWFPIGITLGYKHCMMETLEDMYTKQPIRRNFCMLAAWCKVVTDLKLNTKVQLASHFSKIDRIDIVEHIGVYYKSIHTPEVVYKQIQQITFDRSTDHQFTDMVMVVNNQLNVEINVSECREVTRPTEQTIQEISGVPSGRSLCWTKEVKGDSTCEDSSILSFDEIKQAWSSKEPSNIQNEFLRLLNELSLTKFCPSKITLQDVRSIKSPDLLRTERSIPWLMLTKIIMLNYKAREEDLSLFYEKNAENPVPEPYDPEDDLFEECDESSQINPMDLFFVTFLSCDIMLKQEIVSKLFTCRLAIPILYRDTNRKLVLTKWGLRKILMNNRTENNIVQIDALHYPFKRVSFIRIGHQTLSKSRLLNEIMCDQYHPTFFNRDCQLGGSKRRVANGVVEASWFVSSGPGDPFGEHIMFMNLRGESMDFREEVAILCNLTNILVVHTDILNLDNPDVKEMLMTIHEHNIQVVYALESSGNPAVQPNEIYRNYRNHIGKFKPLTSFFALKSVQQTKSASIVVNELRKIISGMLSETCASSFEVEVSKLTLSDENTHVSLIASQAKAVDVVKTMENNVSLQKHDLLPLQGHLWQEYCTDFKAIYRSKSNDNKDMLISQMKQDRLQLYIIHEKNIHPFVRVFLNHLLALHKSNLIDMYCYLAWIQIYLDDKSRCILPQLISNYQEYYMELKLVNEKKYSFENEHLKQDVIESEKKLVEASFGLEHLFREMGQMYEALIKMNSSADGNSKAFHKFPQILSLLLQNGYAFEIMDADTAMVPITWVKAVFQQLKKDIGDKKLLTISVLGIPNSGKSTLLNAMFGLQFPVSAGRCTRGVFAQLVRVEKGVLPFAYVLVIHTEGLRASNRVEEKHLNEIATFLLGLGNITIINIKRENTAEMEDILQIVVHSFLRLKMANGKLKLEQTCIFLHQNVPTVDVKTDMKISRKKLMDTLDKLTCKAASQKGLAKIVSFSQVIEVNPQSHIWYFADLFLGDSPMSPVNLGYSGMVSEVKRHLLYNIAPQRRTFLSVLETLSRIEDLWNGILTDELGFCFRNSLKLKAYNTLDSTFQHLIWNIDKKIFNFFQSIVRVRFARCIDDIELEKQASEVVSILQREMIENLTLCNHQLNNFIECHSFREMMLQWKQSKSIQLGKYVAEVIVSGVKNIHKNKILQAAELKRKKKREEYELALQAQTQALANQPIGQVISTHKLADIFNKCWDKWMCQTIQENVTKVKSIEKEVERVMLTLFARETSLLQKELVTISSQVERKMLQNSFLEHNLSDEDICIPNNTNKKAILDIQTCKQQALDIVNVVFAKIDSYLSIKSAEDIPFDKKDVDIVFTYLTDTFNQHNTGMGVLTHFKFTTSLKVKIAVRVAKHVTTVFNLINGRYDKKHDIKAQLENYRSSVWEYFQLSMEKNTDDIAIINLLVNTVQKLIEQEIEKRLPTEVEKIIIEEYFPTKYSLMLSIMETLAEKDDFQNFYWYITDAETFGRDWITKFTNNKIFSKSRGKNTRYSSVISKLIEEFIVVIQDCLDFATNTAVKRSKQNDISFWATTFEKTLGCQLPVPYNTFSFIRELYVNDCTFVSKRIKGQIKELIKKLEHAFLQKCSRDVLWKDKNPYNSIFDTLWGCNERCPFCRETCQKTSKNHSDEPHTCVQHRPPGLKGVCKFETNDMSWEPCNYNVYSDHKFFCGSSDGKCQASGRCKPTGPHGTIHVYKEYRKCIPDWEIEPSSLTNTSYYWKWFIYTYRKKLERAYGYKVPEIVNAWKSITKEQAIRSLKIRGHLTLNQY